jgi:small neutral amino acid transporter SnatA (MarC family)
MDLLIKRGHKFDGTLIWDIGKHLPAVHGGIFYVLFSLDYREGESNEDLWRRAVDTFADNLRVVPIE